MKLLRKLWQSNRWALVGFVLAAAVTLFFAERFVIFTFYWARTEHRFEPVSGWMTLGYVERSWDLPRRSLPERLGIAPPPERSGKPKSIAEIAAERGVTVDEMIVQVEKAVKAMAETERHP